MQKRSITIIVFVSLAVTLGSCSAGTRPPNKYEVFYQELALTFGMPEFCRKISPRAQLTAGFNPRGSQVSLVRSQCLYNIVKKYGQSGLCDEVESARSVFLDGSSISAKECRKFIAGGGHEPGITTYNNQPEDLRSILKEMDYTPKDIFGAFEKSFSAQYHDEMDIYEIQNIYSEFMVFAKDRNRVDQSFVKEFVRKALELPNFTE